MTLFLGHIGTQLLRFLFQIMAISYVRHDGHFLFYLIRPLRGTFPRGEGFNVNIDTPKSKITCYCPSPREGIDYFVTIRKHSCNKFSFFWRGDWSGIQAARLTAGVKKSIFAHIRKNSKHLCLNAVSLDALSFIKGKNDF